MLLPALRQDLSLHPGPAAEDGSPTWTLHDPASNRFYRIGWAAFEILSRWHLRDPQAVLQSVQRQTTLQADDSTLMQLFQFLAQHHLLDAAGQAETERLLAEVKAGKLSKTQWLLKNYLFFRIPLVRPAAFLDRCAPYVRWAYQPRFWLALALLAVFGLYMVSRQWEEFTHTFSAYSTFSGWLTVGLALSFAKVLHELGHAFTAQRYGCRVPTMGAAFLVMWPVLYTDTNDAWKLPDKRHRLAIGAAGMLSELALAVVATLLWNVIPDGPLRAGVFMLATTTWVVTLGINASPFMRFDGYFLLSDWLDTPNLHSRAFALGRWWLRRQLFGWDDAAPERLPLSRQRLLIAFAFATWLYRLVVFLGIAFLVYHVFFKLLGFVLLLVELGWFLVLPIMSEPKVWWKRRAEMRWNKETRRTVAVLAALLALLLLPWQHDIRAPAMLGASEVQGLYAVDAARVVKPPIPVGTLVKAGDVLVELESPDLAFRLAKAESHEQVLRQMLEQQPFDTELRQDGTTLQKRWAEAAAETRALKEEADRLIVRAPFAGRVAEANDGLAVGAWVAEREKLFVLTGTTGMKGQAFVGESDMKRLRDGRHDVTFIADTPELGAVHCKTGDIDRINMGNLDALSLASIYGGPIAVERDYGGALVPTEALFRVRLDDCGNGASPPSELRGVAHLEGGGSSLIGAPLHRAFTAIQREMGF